MKIFRGTPGGQVTVEDGGKVTVLPPPTSANTDKYDWGNGGREAGNLAKALAENVLGDAHEAVQVHQMLKHRLVMSLRREVPWEIREPVVMTHIEDIRESAKDAARIRGIVAQQPVPVVYEGGGGNKAAGISSIGRSDHSQEPKPEIPPERRQEPARATNIAAAVTVGIDVTAPQRPSNERGEAIPDDWPEKVDGFRATAGDFVTGTRLIYCLVMCGCYSWQDAAQVSEERLRAVPQWGDALMAEMMEVFAKRNITYVVKEKRQQLLASALAKLTPEEKEAMGLS